MSNQSYFLPWRIIGTGWEVAADGIHIEFNKVSTLFNLVSWYHYEVVHNWLEKTLSEISGRQPKWKNILSGDLFFNILINGLAGMIEDMLATFIDDRKLRELENHWTWIQHFILLQSSKDQSREDTAQPAGCTTACPTWSELHSAHQVWVSAAVLGHIFFWHAADVKTRHGQTTGRKRKGQPHEREVYEKRLEGLGCFSLDKRLPESRIIIFKNGKVPFTKRGE